MVLNVKDYILSIPYLVPPAFSELFSTVNGITVCCCWNLRPPFSVSMKTTRVLEILFYKRKVSIGEAVV